MEMNTVVKTRLIPASVTLDGPVLSVRPTAGHPSGLPTAGTRPCLTSACSSDSTDEPTEVGDEHHRLGHLRQLLPVADETPAAGGQDAEGLLDAPAERDRDEALALPRARGDGEDRAVPGGVAGDVLARVAAVAGQPPQAPAGGGGRRRAPSRPAWLPPRVSRRRRQPAAWARASSGSGPCLSCTLAAVTTAA